MSAAISIALNNPLNIEREANIHWVGMSPTQENLRFIRWLAPEYCYRCAAIILRDYATEGVKTVEAIIARWAPAIENDVANYVRNVVRFTGLTATTVIDASNMAKLFSGMTREEIGSNPYPDAIIAKGIALATPHQQQAGAVPKEVVPVTPAPKATTVQIPPAVMGALKSKTMWLSLLSIVVGALAPHETEIIQTFNLDPQTVKPLLIAAGLIFGVLRGTTTQSLTAKGTQNSTN